jgi:hypothetical protein
MENQEKLATLGTQDTERRKTKHRTQKSKKMNNSKMLDITMRKHTYKTQ